MRTISRPWLLMMIAINAFAADWQPLAEAQMLTAEIDTASIRHVKDKIFEAPFRFNYFSPQKNQASGVTYLSAQVTSRFDCDRKKFAPFRREEFAEKSGKGALVTTVTIPEKKIQFADVQPSSMNEVMYTAVCKICIEKAK